jgi:hypothetical protein
MVAIESDSGLATIPQVQRMLERANSIDEILHVENLAQRVRDFATAAGMGRDAINTAARYALDARRKAGATLIAMKERGELASRGMSQAATFNLADLNLNRTLASHYQQEASVPPEVYEKWVQRIMQSEVRVLNATALRELARRLKSKSDEDDEEDIDVATARKRLRRYVTNLRRQMDPLDGLQLPELLKSLARDYERTRSVTQVVGGSNGIDRGQQGEIKV